jgi:TPR repeat protein
MNINYLFFITINALNIVLCSPTHGSKILFEDETQRPSSPVNLSAFSLEAIPYEMQEYIFSFLPEQSLIALLRVNHSTKAITENYIKERYARDYFKIEDKNKAGISLPLSKNRSYKAIKVAYGKARQLKVTNPEVSQNILEKFIRHRTGISFHEGVTQENILILRLKYLKFIKHYQLYVVKDQLLYNAWLQEQKSRLALKESTFLEIKQILRLCLYLDSKEEDIKDLLALLSYTPSRILPEVQHYVGKLYENGKKTLSQSFKKAAEFYKKAADREYAPAQYHLGMLYEDGRGVEVDEIQAVQWYYKAAMQGNANAQYELAIRYEHGQGVGEDETQAVQWYHKAAIQGNANAQFKLGMRYVNGRGVKKDEVLAVQWFTKAAEQGNANAQYNLGVMYEKGRGVKKDEVLAVQWFTKAAEQGNANAQHDLGVMYVNGRGVKKDEVLAVQWFTKAAEQGDADAQYNLGVMYVKGIGVEKNYIKAHKLVKKAAKQGHAGALSKLDLIYYEDELGNGEQKKAEGI